MILPFIRGLEHKKDIKDNILSEHDVQQEAHNLNTPVDNSFEQSLLQSKEKIEMESLKWKKSDKLR